MCLILENQGLVNLTINKHFKYLLGVYEYMDLVQIGNIGLIKAARSFDESKGYAFSTYAVKCIWGHIANEVRNNNVYSLKPREWENYCKVKKEEGKSTKELAEQLNITCEDVELYKSIEKTNLNSIVNDNTEVGDLISIEGFENVSIDKQFIRVLLKIPFPNYAEMVRLRFFEDIPVKEIAQRFEISEIKASRCIARALKEMRQGKRMRAREAGKKVLQYTVDGKYLNTFKTNIEAAKATGVGRCNISLCLLGKQKTAGGFVWKLA